MPVQILEEQQKFEGASNRLFSVLGVGTYTGAGANSTGVINATTSGAVTTSKGSTPRPRSASASRTGVAPDSSAAPYRMMIHNSSSSTKAAEFFLGTNMNAAGQENVVLSETCMRMGQVAPWTVQEFDSNVGQFRMLFMAHYVIDMKASSNAGQLDGVSCRLAYNIGKYHVQLPFLNIPEASSDEDKLVYIRQCRLHYFFASKHGAMLLFDSKRINVNLYVTRRDSLKNELQYEGSGSINLQSIKWEAPEIEKVDILMPINTVSFGTVFVKLSGNRTSNQYCSLINYLFIIWRIFLTSKCSAVAVEFSPTIPWQAINEHFAKERVGAP